MNGETQLKMETEHPQPTRPADPLPQPAHPSPARPAKPRSNLTAWIVVGAVIVLIIGVVLWKKKSAPPAAESITTPVVAAVKVTRQDLFNEVTIPAEFRPYAEVELHAKVSGYVKSISVDFGDRVKAGQLLATLEVPELQDQLHSAMALQQKANADYTNSNLMYTRLQTVNRQHPDLVAQQDLDTAQAKQDSAAAEIAGAKADVDRYQTLANYTRIVAPFDGVITHRYADPGSLIQAGTTSDSQSMPLVRVSDNYHLRLDFPISVEHVKDIHLGDPVEVRVESLNDKPFAGKISRFMNRVNQDTRTMIVELEVPNPNLEIVPGMYASVELKVENEPLALAVPVQAVSTGATSTVYIINGDSEIESRPVKLGVETPNDYQVISGLKEGELVMIGNRTSVQPGQKVEAKLVNPPSASEIKSKEN
jgi:RND family efflux transporter MFP subunit